MRERKRRQEELTACDFSTLALYMPGSMNRTKASALDGPKPGVLPVAPLTSVVAAVNGKRITSIDDRAQA